MKNKEKIIFYLVFAKTKLMDEVKSHTEAIKEIEEIIQVLKVEDWAKIGLEHGHIRTDKYEVKLITEIFPNWKIEKDKEIVG